MAEPCEPFDLTCKAKEWATSAVGDAIGSLADGVMEAFGHAIGGLGTIWVRIGTPNLTGGASVVPTGQPPGTAGIDTVLGYATWIGFGVAILGLIAAGVRLAVSRSGQTQQAVERIGVVLIAVILISASVGIVTGLLSGARTGSPTVSFLQNSLWYYTMAVAVLGVIVAGARMAWEQRAEPGRQLIQGLLTLVVVAGAGLSVVALLTTAADSFSVWILNNSLDCNIAAGDGTCFGKSMFQLLALTAGTAGAGGFGAVLVIILGVVAVFAALAQIVLMIVRAGALVVLAGMLPVAAAASLSDPQRTMLRKTSAWLLGFILYKPAAAIVYATAFRLTGTDLFGDDGLVTVLTGLALMLLALVALPALMRLIVPAITAVSSGSGGMAGMALAGAAAALPTGAALTSRASGSGGNGSSGSGGGSGPSGAGPSGASPAAGGGPAAGGSTAGGGPAAGAAGSSGAAAAGGAGSSGAAAGGAAAGGAAASGAAAGSAAAAVPPVAAASAAMNAAGAAGNAARSAAESATGGPDGAL